MRTRNFFPALSLSILLFIGCSKKNNDSLDRIQANVADVAVVSQENITNGLTEIFSNSFDTVNLDKHLPHTNGIWGYESAFNYIILNKEEEVYAKNHRIALVFGNDNELEDDLSGDPIQSGALKIQNDELGTFKIYKNVWGKGQMVIHIQLNDESLSSIENFKNKSNLTSRKINNIGKSIQKLVVDCHNLLGLEGSIGYCEKGDTEFAYTDSVMTLLKKNYGFTFFVPNSFRIMQADSNFVWLTKIKREGGYEAIMINIHPQAIELSQLSNAVNDRNNFTTKYLHNDEGTKIVVSESGAYNPFFAPSPKQANKLMYGWYTELGTFRRGPFGRYYYTNGTQQIAVDWFAGGADRYNNIKAQLDLIARSFKFVQ